MEHKTSLKLSWSTSIQDDMWYDAMNMVNVTATLLSRESVPKRNNSLHYFFLLLRFHNTSQISLHRRPDIFYWIQIRRWSWGSHNTLCQLVLLHPLSSWLTCMLSVIVLQLYTPEHEIYSLYEQHLIIYMYAYKLGL